MYNEKIEKAIRLLHVEYKFNIGDGDKFEAVPLSLEMKEMCTRQAIDMLKSCTKEELIEYIYNKEILK